jgi:hypothetical protein
VLDGEFVASVVDASEGVDASGVALQNNLIDDDILEDFLAGS